MKQILILLLLFSTLKLKAQSSVNPSLKPCVLLQESGFFNEAVDCYIKALEKGANKNTTYYNLATIYFGNEQYYEATIYGSLAVEADTTRSNGFNIRGMARYYLGQKDEGLTDLIKAFELDENNQGAVVSIVLILEDYWGETEIQTQLYFCNKAIVLDPHNGAMYKRRGLLRLLGGDKSFGCLDLKKAISFGITDLSELYSEFCK